MREIEKKKGRERICVLSVRIRILSVRVLAKKKKERKKERKKGNKRRRENVHSLEEREGERCVKEGDEEK